MLKNAPTLAIRNVDTAENESCKVWPNLATFGKIWQNLAKFGKFGKFDSSQPTVLEALFGSPGVSHRVAAGFLGVSAMLAEKTKEILADFVKLWKARSRLYRRF